MLTAAILSALTVSFVSACGDGHDHSLHKRLPPPPGLKLAKPTRPLEWGDVNFLSTTDTHGWLLGHQKTSFPEPNYSGDLGDFSSFIAHMKKIAKEKKVDLLLVDSGDLHDGTVLSDGFPAGGVDAQQTNKFVSQLPYDIMAIGNHELYIYNNTLDMYNNFAPGLKGRYLSSNVNITVTGDDGQPKSVPVGERFRKFKTEMGRKVTAFGVLYNFAGGDKGTTVQKVADMVNEPWFLDAIKEEPDFFLLAGHMPVQKDNWPLVFNTIRAIHPTTPIMIFGGHTHIRDCTQLDPRSMAIESGRYMETVGWMSAKLDKKNATAPIEFSRRYLDPNRVTYAYHSKTYNSTFDTALGKRITAGLKQLAVNYEFDLTYGTAPQDYGINTVPYPANNSALSLFISEAVPVAMSINNTRTAPALFITNSGSQRFNIYKGPFTKNDQLTTSPFADAFLYIPAVPSSVANKVLPALNHAGSSGRKRELEERGSVEHIYREWLEQMDRAHGVERREAANLTYGYVTQDSCPGVGDDIVHAPLPFHAVPDFIASASPAVADDAPIDLVFVDFIENQLITILNTVQSTKNYTTADVAKYSPILTNAVLGYFAQEKWN